MRTPHESTLQLPPGYVLHKEKPNFLVLRRADGSVVGAFPVSITEFRPKIVPQTAGEDHRKLTEGQR